MRKRIMNVKSLIFVVLFIISINEIFSQWVTNNEMYELSEKIPDIQDLRIFPDENLIITVSKDNSIRYINYDAGIISKTFKPDNLNENNDFAKISNDGKTTICGNFQIVPGIKKQLDDLREVKIYIIDNNSAKVIGEYLITYDKFFTEPSNFMWIDYFSINYAFCDYDYDINHFIMIFNYSLSYLYRSAINERYEESLCFSGYLENSKFIVNKEQNRRKINNITFDNESKNFLSVESSSFYQSGGSNPPDSYEYSALSEYNTNLDNFKTFLEYKYYNKNENNNFVQLQQAFYSYNIDEFLITAPKIMYHYDKYQMKLTDSLINTLFSKNLTISNHGHYIHSFDSSKYSINQYPNLKEIFSYNLKKDLRMTKPIIDDKFGSALFYFADGTIGIIKPEIMKPINDIGFIISKDTVYTNEDFNVFAITSVDSCEFEWQFYDGIIDQQNTDNVKFKYINPGYYDIKLTIKTPDGKSFVYEKPKAITVLQTLKADFDIKVLDSELPVRVEFINKSIGESLKYIWNFGDGQTDTTENPIHVYRLSGDFSPSLYIFDDKTHNKMIKYEGVLINTKTPVYQNPRNVYKFNSGINNLKRVFPLDSGFCLYYERKEFKKVSDNGINHDYKFLGFLYNDIFIFNDEFELNDKISQLNGYRESFDEKPNLFNMEQMLDCGYLIIRYFNWQAIFRIYNIYNKKEEMIFHSDFGFYVENVKSMLNSMNGSIYLLYNYSEFCGISNIDYHLKSIWKTPFDILGKSKNVFADNNKSNLYLLLHNQDNSFQFCSTDPNGLISSLDFVDINRYSLINNVKSLNDNLLIIFGKIYNIQTKSYHSMFAKFNTKDKEYLDTIFNERTEIQKIVRINNKYFAAIGTSRGTQGFMIIDSNLNLFKDIRVNGLYGDLKDIIVKNNNVYLFKQDENAETNIIVLPLPQDIISNIEEPKNILPAESILTCFPNPAIDFITINLQPSEGLNPSEGSEVEIYNSFGVLILQDVQHLGDVGHLRRFDVSKLPVGLYFVKIGNRIEKFVKM